MRPIDADELQEYLTDLLLNCESWINSTTDEEILTTVNANYKSFLEVLSHVKDIPTLKDIPKWISCEEKLPEKDGEYLVTLENGYVRSLGYSIKKQGMYPKGFYHLTVNGMFAIPIKYGIVAWMSLPEPYKKRY